MITNSEKGEVELSIDDKREESTSSKRREPIRAINWNEIPDDKDKEVWDRLTSNFWLPEKIPVSNDQKSWANLNEAEREATMRVFTGLTLLDTIQGNVGAVRLAEDAVTMHEEAVYGNINFMEAFATGTELLTKNGWKDITKITEQDEVAQYHQDTGVVDFAHPTIVPSHYADEVYEISTADGKNRQVVSGGHRVYYEIQDGYGNWRPAVSEARDLESGYIEGNIRFRTVAPTVEGEALSALDRFRIAAYHQSRHSAVHGDKKDFYFLLNDNHKVTAINEIVTDLGWTIDKQNGNSTNQSAIKVSAPLDVTIDTNGTIRDQWEFSEKSSTWFREFITETVQWGSSQVSDGSAVITTRHDNDTQILSVFSARAGWNHEILTDEDTTSVRIALGGDEDTVQNMMIDRVDAQEVYCVQVPSTFLVTRNGSSPVISGNCVHAKSYSNIFMTLADTPSIDKAFNWSETNKNLQYKAHRIVDLYEGDDPLKRKIASVLLESFLFYSGFYLPFRFSSMGKLTNTADIIRLIVRDESIHGYYIGYKYQVGIDELTDEQRSEYQSFTVDLLLDLYQNELEYTEDIYDPLGWTEDVKKFLRYNANKAMNNLGYPVLFPADYAEVSPSILSAMSPNADENHDFFSGSGSSYVIGEVEETDDDDWDF